MAAKTTKKRSAKIIVQTAKYAEGAEHGETVNYSRRVSRGGLSQREESEDVPPEVKLWRAVLTQALMDIKNKPNNRDEQMERIKTEYWLTKSNPHFKAVCSFAMLDPDYVSRKIQKAISTGIIYRIKRGEIKAPDTKRRITHAFDMKLNEIPLPHIIDKLRSMRAEHHIGN